MTFEQEYRIRQRTTSIITAILILAAMVFGGCATTPATGGNLLIAWNAIACNGVGDLFLNEVTDAPLIDKGA